MIDINGSSWKEMNTSYNNLRNYRSSCCHWLIEYLECDLLNYMHDLYDDTISFLGSTASELGCLTKCLNL
jgi:hypothetical protein